VIGVICLTEENKHAPWVLFEAGALSRGLTKNRVAPLLIDLSPQDVQGPLANFNLSGNTKDEIAKLVKMINKEAEKPLAEQRLQASFDRCWDEFRTKFDALRPEAFLV
jgi:hypothetical protein